MRSSPRVSEGDRRADAPREAHEPRALHGQGLARVAHGGAHGAAARAPPDAEALAWRELRAEAVRMALALQQASAARSAYCGRARYRVARPRRDARPLRGGRQGHDHRAAVRRYPGAHPDGQGVPLHAALPYARAAGSDPNAVAVRRAAGGEPPDAPTPSAASTKGGHDSSDPSTHLT